MGMLKGLQTSHAWNLRAQPLGFHLGAMHPTLEAKEAEKCVPGVGD